MVVYLSKLDGERSVVAIGGTYSVRPPYYVYFDEQK